MHAIPKFHLISWCGNFVERRSFRRVSVDLPETLRKRCLSTKFPHQEIRVKFRYFTQWVKNWAIKMANQEHFVRIKEWCLFKKKRSINCFPFKSVKYINLHCVLIHWRVLYALENRSSNFVPIFCHMTRDSEWKFALF